MPTAEAGAGFDFLIEARQDTVPEQEFTADLNRLRAEKGPVVSARFPFGDDFGGVGYLALGFEEAKQALNDPRFTVVTGGADYPRMRPNEGDRPPAQPSFVNTDGPEHVAKRRVFSKALTVKRVLGFKERTEEIVKQKLDALEAKGPGADIIQDFAIEVPLTVLCALIGVPEGEGDEFVHAAIASMTGRVKDEQEAAANFGIMVGYFKKMLQAKREHPTGDLVSDIVADVDATGAWTEEELEGLGVAVLSAGHDAPASILGGIAYHLAYNPDLLTRLRENPDQIPAAVEEYLRFLPAGYGIRPRLATEDVEIGGVTVKKGQSIMAVVHLANADPEVFERSDVFDMDREPTPHIRFGFGPHMCPGNQLARMELEVATRQLVERFPNLRPVTYDENWRAQMLMRGPKTLAVTW